MFPAENFLAQTLSSQHVQAYGNYPTGLEELILRGGETVGAPQGGRNAPRGWPPTVLKNPDAAGSASDCLS